MDPYLGLIFFFWIVGASGVAAKILDQSLNRTARTKIFANAADHFTEYNNV